MKDWKEGDIAVIKRGEFMDGCIDNYIGKIIIITNIHENKHLPVSTNIGTCFNFDELRPLTKLDKALR